MFWSQNKNTDVLSFCCMAKKSWMSVKLQPNSGFRSIPYIKKKLGIQVRAFGLADCGVLCFHSSYIQMGLIALWCYSSPCTPVWDQRDSCAVSCQVLKEFISKCFLASYSPQVRCVRLAPKLLEGFSSTSYTVINRYAATVVFPRKHSLMINEHMLKHAVSSLGAVSCDLNPTSMGFSCAWACVLPQHAGNQCRHTEECRPDPPFPAPSPSSPSSPVFFLFSSKPAAWIECIHQSWTPNR